MRNTKIVATLGPATASADVVGRLFDAGVDVFRLNASHGTERDHAASIARVRTAAGERGVEPCILLDLQGPKIRLGRFEGGASVLERGAMFTITTEDVVGNAERASTSYERFARDVKAGDTVLLADGSIQLEGIRSDGASVLCRVVRGGEVRDRQGINLPGVEISTPSLTDKDIGDLEFGLGQGVDFVALSFVRRPDDVRSLRRLLARGEASAQIIAKIEKPEAWENFDGILAESDGVMVARGDLGVEVALDKVPFIQKTIIRAAREKGKVVITATQMLESMMDKPYPTRAEVSDVANAIWDGTDAVMLSGETAVGKYPVEAAARMASIAVETESHPALRGYGSLPLDQQASYPEILAAACHQAAGSAGVKAIAVFTRSGSSAQVISRLRPPLPVYAFTPSPQTARALRLSYGVHPVVAPAVTGTDQMLAALDRMLRERAGLHPGDGVALVAGVPGGPPGSTDFLHLHRLGEFS